MPDSPLQLVGGRVTQVPAVDTGGTAAAAGKVIAADSTGRLDPSLLPTGVGADTFSGTAAEALAAGDMVAITSGGIRKASAGTTGSDVDGFVLSAVTNGGTALVYLEGRNTALTGLTVGARYYLSETAGQVTATPVSGAGKKHQYLGRAITTSSLAFEPDDSIVLAA